MSPKTFNNFFKFVSVSTERKKGKLRIPGKRIIILNIYFARFSLINKRNEGGKSVVVFFAYALNVNDIKTVCWKHDKQPLLL